MSEKNVWERVRAHLKDFGHLQRIETGMMTDAGVPDVNYCFDGREGWIELKHGAQPARATTVVFKSQRGLDPAQIEWQLYRVRCGGCVYNLIQVGKWLILIHGKHAAKINRCTTQELLDLATWKRSGAVKSACWSELATALREGW